MFPDILSKFSADPAADKGVNFQRLKKTGALTTLKARQVQIGYPGLFPRGYLHHEKVPAKVEGRGEPPVKFGNGELHEINGKQKAFQWEGKGLRW